MLQVTVTVAIGRRHVAQEDVSDLRTARLLKEAGMDVANKLGPLRCPVHAKGATNVRLHFDKNGAADLRYESCCEALTKKIVDALG